MFTQAKKYLSMAVMAGMLFSVSAGVASAQDLAPVAGDSPATAVQPSEGVVTIAPNTWQWYAFRSQVPVDVDSDGNDVVTNPSDATIDAILRTQSGNVDFEVWSSDNINEWRNDNEFDAMGGGTENEFLPGDPLSWQGSFEENETYYLIVMNRSGQSASYALDILGNVRFPTELTLDAVLPTIQEPVIPADLPVMSTGELALTVETPAEVEVAVVETVMENAGFGPETAMMPANGMVTIQPGEWQWYSFKAQVPVDVDSDGNDVVTDLSDATVDAILRTQYGNIDFEVWSNQNINDWRNDKEFDIVGAGTENEFITGDPLSWQGTFETNETLYLIVQNNSGQPASYSLDISGNVAFPTSTMLAVQ